MRKSTDALKIYNQQSESADHTQTQKLQSTAQRTYNKTETAQ